MKTFNRLLSYVKYRKFSYLIGILLLLISAALTIYAPIIGSRLINYVSLQTQEAEVIELNILVTFFVQYLGLIILSAAIGYGSFLILAFASNDISRIIRNEVHEHMQNLPISYFDDKPAAKISARIVNDTEVLRENFYQNFSTQVLLQVVQVVGTYVALILVSRPVGLTMLIMLPIFVLWQLGYMKMIQPLNHRWRESVSEMNSQTAEIVQGASIVQIFQRQESMADDFEKTNQEWLDSRRKTNYIDSTLTWNLSGFLKNTVTLLVMMYLGTLFTEGILGYSMGVLFILIDYVNRIFDPITMIVRLMTMFQQALVAGHRVFEMMDTPIEEDSERELIVKAGQVSFNKVNFGYKTGQTVLKDINFSVAQGETVGLVGHTGSGKSSIINLLFRFYDPQSGQILLDGQNIKEFNRESVRDEMGIVLQEPYLFTGTIASNISMNDASITEEMIQDAINKVGARPMIDKLELGIHTPVVEKGQSLSSGERQLISFARTLASNPKILILDEATSHIDTETEEVIQHAMNVVKEGRTTFIIAHRLSTIQNADQIILLDQGMIKEHGNHQELLNLEGQYAEMFHMQAKAATV
ncbi:ATP-binding cassette domain-containing protein [Aerococcaceae bacterium DSM 109653]|uniref:ATP-binding cassette domain-containing protein n=1 Tax=Fundicoccus ignavus TaxID=2664442 RepID=A0A844BMI8_9LACT|nr:ABC transporter ATP-binding protein [Fundicoccus ignavus]MRI81398.1 ATP-binding cassette domain-containing protein [Fundicoccus ignavus]